MFHQYMSVHTDNIYPESTENNVFITLSAEKQNPQWTADVCVTVVTD